MNLAKQEIQKIVLSLILLVAFLYVYFTVLLGPLLVTQEKEVRNIQELNSKIQEASRQIQKTKTLEAKVPEATKDLAGILSKTPQGAPVAWFPPKMAEFFKSRGMEKAVTRLTSETPEPELEGFRKLAWSVELPRSEFLQMGKAVADLENGEPLIQVLGIQVEGVAGEPLLQHTTMSIATVLKQ